MKDRVTIFAPATVSNLGSGFDVLGFALDHIGDTITLSKRSDNKLVIEPVTGAELPTHPDQNVCTIVIQAMLAYLGLEMGLNVGIHKQVMPGSGLGSSASSSAGAAVALNALLGYPLDNLELTRMAMKGEEFLTGIEHADNVAPCIFGGCTLIRSYDPLDIIPIDIPDLVVAVIHPQVVIKTADAKRILGNTLELSTARTQWANLAGLMIGFSRGDFDLMDRSMKDVVAEPKRAALIPHFSEVRSVAASKGVIGFNISGSGPAMFGFCRDLASAKAFTQDAKELYNGEGLEVITYISSVSLKGAREIL